MPEVPREADIETGALSPEVFADWNFNESRLSCASNYLAGELCSLPIFQSRVRPIVQDAGSPPSICFPLKSVTHCKMSSMGCAQGWRMLPNLKMLARSRVVNCLRHCHPFDAGLLVLLFLAGVLPLSILVSTFMLDHLPRNQKNRFLEFYHSGEHDKVYLSAYKEER